MPELASRDHIAKLLPMVESVLAEAELGLRDLDAIAYTAGPGLIGALLVGGSLASSLAYALKIPAIPVHHLEGHLLACMLEAPAPEFPFLALMVSGGHSQLIEVAGVGRYRIIGETLDDAAGEAFDKVARLLGLPYPGGPELAALAERGDARRFALPRPLKNQGLDMSFSGLKTAARLTIDACRGADGSLADAVRADVAASFQAAVVDTLTAKCRQALEATGLTRLVVAGGVGANRALAREPRRARRASRCARVLSEAGAVHRQRRHDRVRGLVSANCGADEPRIVARPRWPLDELEPPP